MYRDERKCIIIGYEVGYRFGYAASTVKKNLIALSLQAEGFFHHRRNMKMFAHVLRTRCSVDSSTALSIYIRFSPTG